MRIAVLHNHFDTEHLEHVVKEMRTLGAPTIRIYNLGFGDMYQALEGCHRLRACELLGVTPDFEMVDAEETVESLNLDFENGDDPAEIRVCEMGDWENYQIIINEDGDIVTGDAKNDYS